MLCFMHVIVQYKNWIYFKKRKITSIPSTTLMCNISGYSLKNQKAEKGRIYIMFNERLHIPSFKVKLGISKL